MKLIIIIGIPLSGKTEYSKTIKDCIVYDDFITTFYNGNVIKSLINKDNVCVIDPRLCIPRIFDQYIKRFELYVDRDDIELIVFENDPIQCIKNIGLRSTNILLWTTTIQSYSKSYKVEKYVEWGPIVLPVYSSSSDSLSLFETVLNG